MKNNWYKDSIETYPCPQCGRGEIVFSESKSHIQFPTAETIDLRPHNPPWTENLHTAMVKCNKCSDPVAITFSKVVNEDPDPFYYQELENGREKDNYFHHITIRNIYPAPHIINIPNGCDNLFPHL